MAGVFEQHVAEWRLAEVREEATVLSPKAGGLTLSLWAAGGDRETVAAEGLRHRRHAELHRDLPGRAGEGGGHDEEAE